MRKEAINANNIRDEILFLALTQYGKKYVHDTYGPDTYDCAGLVWYIYKKVLGINIFNNGYGKSTTTKIMTSNYGKLTIYNTDIKDIKLIKKGDIVFLHRQSLKDNEPRVNNKYPGHCGIYIGNNAFIHASGTEKRIVISDFNNEYWYKKIVGYKDYEEEFELVKSKFNI